VRGGRAGRILVTGSTGFIGRAVARRLLAAGGRVTLLARSRDGASAAARVAAALGPGLAPTDVEVVEADLDAEPLAGLGLAEIAHLRATVDTVIHCAGETVFFPEYPERFRAGHVAGPVRLLETLASGGLRTWAHLSTAYVCGRRTGTVFESESDVGQDFHNPYERVKLEAETAIRAAGQRAGVDVRVFRPSAVVGRAPDTAGGSPSTLLFQFIRAVARLATAPGARRPLRIGAAPGARFNIVPVGYVARSLAALARCPDAAGGTFHLVVADAPRQEAMLRMITDPLGARGLRLVAPARLARDATPLERRLGLRLARYRDYLTRDVRFDDANARRALARHGLAPATLEAADVRRLIRQALRGHRPRRGAAGASRRPV
jgi:nucleoside-diphosphate-sugar epimerase